MSRIVRIELGRYDYAFAGEFKFFQPRADGLVVRPTVLVRLTDAAGHTGWGQAVPVPSWTYETPETVASTLEHYLAPVVLGRDPADFAGLHHALNTAIRPAFSVGQPLCKAALDLACHDLVGKARHLPAWRLLEPETSAVEASIKLSWTVASPDPAVSEQQLAEGWERGYRNFNIKVGAPQSAAYDVELARRVRRFSPGGFLWADANTAYNAEEALDMASRLRDAGVDVLESPLPPTAIRGYQNLRALGALPILMDEGILSAVELREFIELGMLDGVAMKPARNAGLWPSARMVRTLRDHGLMVLGSGLTDPDFSLAGAVHLFAWSDITHPCALNGPQFLAERLDESFVPEGDVMTLPTLPGLGLEPDARAEACLRIVAELWRTTARLSIDKQGSGRQCALNITTSRGKRDR